MYYVISSSEDGIGIEQLTKEELEIRLSDEYYGKVEFATTFPKDSDPNYWGKALLIIKGELVLPRPIQVVKEFQLP